MSLQGILTKIQWLIQCKNTNCNCLRGVCVCMWERKSHISFPGLCLMQLSHVSMVTERAGLLMWMRVRETALYTMFYCTKKTISFIEYNYLLCFILDSEWRNICCIQLLQYMAFWDTCFWTVNHRILQSNICILTLYLTVVLYCRSKV